MYFTRFLFYRSNRKGFIVAAISIALYVVISGIYVYLVPANISGEQNIGILFSILGLVLFIVDHFYRIKKSGIPLLLFLRTEWWAFVFLATGFGEWVSVYSQTNLALFYIHWITILGISIFVFWKFPLGKKKPVASQQAGVQSSTETPS